MHKLDDWCKELAVTGYEEKITDYLVDTLGEFCNKIYKDAIGNVICLRKGSSPEKKILVMAHIDEVGLQVTNIMENGLYRFKTLGNIKCWNLFQQRIVFENGVKGIILADDDTKIGSNNYENLYIKVIEQDFTIEIGDICTFDASIEITKDIIVGKALDNRAACFILFSLLKEQVPTKNDIYYVFSTQEELGMKGAKVAISNIKPDQIIIMDASPEGKNNNIKCSNGVAIKLSDSLGISNRQLINNFKKIASDEKINYQLEVSNCGTSEMIIVNESGVGSKNITLSIPCTGMHTANSIVSLKDIDETFKLILSYLREFA